MELMGVRSITTAYFIRRKALPMAWRGSLTHLMLMEISLVRMKPSLVRTVPVILKHGAKQLQVDCFLDEGSDMTYVNEDVVEESFGR